jgi:NADPH:quinone reductase-like Zn-dependent oxidoreductase
LSDAELATFSCSYSTAEGMLTRAGMSPGRHRSRPRRLGRRWRRAGATGQAARRPGDRHGVGGQAPDVAALGPDRLLPRAPDDLRAALGGEKITVVADVVGGPYWPNLIDILERGGRYTCSGAIAGPMVTLDLRTFYLNDLTLTGSTIVPPDTLAKLVSYIEAGDVKPVLAATYPLSQLREAQAAFIAKTHTGNIAVTMQ